MNRPSRYLYGTAALTLLFGATSALSDPADYQPEVRQTVSVSHNLTQAKRKCSTFNSEAPTDNVAIVHYPRLENDPGATAQLVGSRVRYLETNSRRNRVVIEDRPAEQRVIVHTQAYPGGWCFNFGPIAIGRKSFVRASVSLTFSFYECQPIPSDPASDANVGATTMRNNEILSALQCRTRRLNEKREYLKYRIDHAGLRAVSAGEHRPQIEIAESGLSQSKYHSVLQVAKREAENLSTELGQIGLDAVSLMSELDQKGLMIGSLGTEISSASYLRLGEIRNQLIQISTESRKAIREFRSRLEDIAFFLNDAASRYSDRIQSLNAWLKENGQEPPAIFAESETFVERTKSALDLRNSDVDRAIRELISRINLSEELLAEAVVRDRVDRENPEAAWLRDRRRFIESIDALLAPSRAERNGVKPQQALLPVYQKLLSVSEFKLFCQGISASSSDYDGCRYLSGEIEGIRRYIRYTLRSLADSNLTALGVDSSQIAVVHERFRADDAEGAIRLHDEWLRRVAGVEP